MRTPKQLINLIVAANGGSMIRTARQLDATVGQVGNWRFRNKIPGNHRFRFREIANRHGANLPESWLDASKARAKPKRAEIHNAP